MADYILTQKDDGQSLQVPVGARIKIDLPENPTTGYRWNVQELESESIAVESDNYTSGEGVGIGGAGIRHFTFQAKAPGKATINLKNKRQWEPEEKAMSQFSVVIFVR